MTKAPTRAGSQPASITWQQSEHLVPYADALTAMEHHVDVLQKGEVGELGWLLEHPPLYTAGTSAKDDDLLVPDRFPVFKTGRGGQYTYHGPGQRIAYMMLDLRRRGQDLRRYVWQLEEWIIQTLRWFDIEGERRDGRVGIWVVKADGKEAKIAAIGVRVRRWITFHGIAINLEPDLSHYSSIVPCGLGHFGVTSMADLGSRATLAELDERLMGTFEDVFAEKTGSTMSTADQIARSTSSSSG